MVEEEPDMKVMDWSESAVNYVMHCRCTSTAIFPSVLAAVIEVSFLRLTVTYPYYDPALSFIYSH